MNGTKAKPSLLHVPRLEVSADGAGVVSHAGVGLLREVADLSGLSSQVSGVLSDTFKGPWVHDPGRVFTDLAAAVADGADCVSGIGQLLDQQAQHGPVASVTTSWRMIDQRIDAQHLAGVKKARSTAREKVWAAGGAPQVCNLSNYMAHIVRIMWTRLIGGQTEQLPNGVGGVIQLGGLDLLSRRSPAGVNGCPR